MSFRYNYFISVCNSSNKMLDFMIYNEFNHQAISPD